MLDTYDCIVIGAGNAGLVSALELARENKKVLVLDSNNTPGGFATSFIRGRFEFEASLQALYDYGSRENPGKIYTLFDNLNIREKIKMIGLKEAIHIYDKENNAEYRLPFGIEEFTNQMEIYVEGSKKSVEDFFALALEVENAIQYLEDNDGIYDEEILRKEYENFMKIATLSVDKVLDILKMPKKAQEILTSLWIMLGSPTENLSFVHFSIFLYTYVTLKTYIPCKRSHEISAILAEEIEKAGGEIKYLSTVKEILFKDKKIAGVQLQNGEIYRAKHIITSASPHNVYKNLIPKPMVPKEALKLTNSRVLGAKAFTIFLGVNQSAEDLKLMDYNYTIYNTLNSNKEFQNMNNIKNTSCIATVLNNAIPFCSPKGTCILTLTSFFFGDAFTKNVNEKNYFTLKNEIAKEIIENFEKITKIRIQPYIEEIEIATPITYARYGNHPNGVVFGYKATGLDNLLPRLMCRKNENYIKNLRFCGGFSERLAGFSATYISGDKTAKRTLKDIKREELGGEEEW